MSEDTRPRQKLTVLCTGCLAVWTTSANCVCDCLICGTRIVTPEEGELREDELAERRKRDIQRVK